jgi:hypothetical protein
MADTLLLRSLKSQPKLLKLNNKKLNKVPRLIGQFTNVINIELKNNKITTLPRDFGELVQVCIE